MRFRPTPLAGARVVEVEPHHDARGYFTRTWCAEEFERNGLPARMVQASLSSNRRRATLRGMHTQLPPSREGKLVSCVRGRVHDVIVDLRPGSPTFLDHFAIELSAEAHNALYIPPTFLHGFLTLEDNCEVFYQMTDTHAPHLAFGARWNDAAFGIEWPINEGLMMSDRDRAYPDFDLAAYQRAVTAPTLTCSG